MTSKVRHYCSSKNAEMMQAEDEMKDWVKMFIEEIDRVEASFLKRYEEYKLEYSNLNSRFTQKQADLF